MMSMRYLMLICVCVLLINEVTCFYQETDDDGIDSDYGDNEALMIKVLCIRYARRFGYRYLPPVCLRLLYNH
ncbi:hypothetical protein SNE40_013503 [Patella caerulea]|uniref:Uncharacterized protein n=1 Tax=Patella caerulea TaxID=87958 RepID=A0AAN8JG16_PATCE